MPTACSTTVLTGVDGSAAFKPSGTKACLLDFTDFPAGSGIIVPATSDFRVGDPVKFTAQGLAQIDSALTPGNVYHVVSVTPGVTPGAGHPKIGISATAHGTAITLEGDGGTGTGDSPNSEANHILIAFSEHKAVCQVQSWSMNLSREEVDTTALQCGPGTAGGRMAPFRTKQGGFVNGTGSMVVRFTRDQRALSRRLLQNSLYKNQDGASVQLFVDTIYDGSGKLDLAQSLYLEGEISILGFDLGATVGSDPIQGTVNFSFSQQPTNILGQL